MTLEGAVAWAFAALALAGGAMAAWQRHILYAIIGLGLSLFGLAGLFLYLGSAFVAAMQLLIYIGGITVAIVFAMMLSIAMTVAPQPRSWTKTAFAALCATAFGLALYRALAATDLAPLPPAPRSAWSVAHIGAALLEHYNLVFEALSVALLVAVIGAILVARPERAGR